MRTLWTSLLVLGLAVTGPAAQAQTVKPALTRQVKSPSAAAKAKPLVAETEKADLLLEMQQLRQLVTAQSRELAAQRAMLQEQQQKMQELERRVGEQMAMAAPTAQAAEVAQARDVQLLEGQLEAVADGQKALGEKVTRVESDLANNKKATEGKLRNLGNFAFSGDFRGRFESFNGGTLATARYRERFRLRFNVNAKFSDELEGGFTLASGDLNDPISTNQTLTTFYERKPVALDKAFLTYKPKWFKPLGNLSITGGKFAYTWYRTELTFDNDLNVEGISPALSWDIKTALLKRVALVGYALPFNESSSGRDGFLSGAQVQTQWQFGNRFSMGGYLGFTDFNNADSIRAGQTAGTVGGSTNNNAATSTRYASKFGLLNAILRVDMKTPWSRWPVMAQLDYVNNTRACTNLVNISGTKPACNPRDRDAYWAEVQFGQTREQGDLNFGYTFMRIEREAVLGAFNFSDIRSPSNILTHRLNLAYQAYRNITIGWTGLLGRQLVTAGTPTKEDTLRRMQLDFIYKF